MREHVIHEIIKRLVDSQLTCPVPINNLLDQAFLKHLNAFDGCKLCLGTGILSMKTSQFNCSKISTKVNTLLMSLVMQSRLYGAILELRQFGREEVSIILSRQY